jgi:hypothetical protein
MATRSVEWRIRQSMERSMKMALRTLAVAASTFACATLFSFGWSGQDGVTLSVNKAEAQARVYITSRYASRAVYVPSDGLAWYAVRAYYFNGPWSGPGYNWAGWADYAARAGIGCVPGSIVKGGDGIMYNCQ